MNSVSGWFAIPLSLAVLGITFIVLRCLRRKHVSLTVEGLGVKININTIEKGINEKHSQIDHNDHAESDPNQTWINSCVSGRGYHDCSPAYSGR